MFFQKTRDIIVETATIVKGVKDSQDVLQKDFKEHVADGERKTANLYKVIKECHEQCPEKQSFDNYVKTQNGTLLRIEKKYDKYHEEVSNIKVAKKTFRQIMSDIGKGIGCLCLLGGLVFGIIRYCEAKKTTEDVKIEMLLEEIIKEQRVEKEYREERG